MIMAIPGMNVISIKLRNPGKRIILQMVHPDIFI